MKNIYEVNIHDFTQFVNPKKIIFSISIDI